MTTITVTIVQHYPWLHPGVLGNSMSVLIGLYDVSRRFDDGRIVALDHVTLEVEAGAAIAVAGRSGCGKTTLLHVMSGLGRPDSGSVVFDGRPVANAGAWRWLRAHRIGIVFQHFNLLPMLTAAENVEAPMLGIERSPSVRRRRALELLAQVGLAERAEHRPATLSGGERQRVAIARSLANRPDLLLADEPTGNLDSATSVVIADLLLRMHREQRNTLVLVTHDAELAARMETRIHMGDGRLMAPSGAPVELARAEPG